MAKTTRGGLIGRLADEFDLSWRKQPPADIEAYYQNTVNGPGGVLDPAGRLALLEELIRLDLEYRWRPADKVRGRWMVADYVRRFTALQSNGWNAVALLAEEFRVRWQWGDRPDRKKFVEEHSHWEPHLTPVLVKVESSLGLRPTPQSAAPVVPPADRSSVKPSTNATLPRPTTLWDQSHSQLSERPLPPSQPAPRFPTVADYQITREIAEGGMGVVYEAFDPALKRTVALKLVLKGGRAGTEELARFRKEAQAIARLKHPNIVQILQFGEAEGQPYFALEYVAGGSLAGFLKGNPQSAEFTATVVQALANGMAAAHAEGIIHRDLKPGNVLLDHPPGAIPTASTVKPKVTDFGLVKTLDDDSGQTHDGAIMGTPSYMAPEQAAGRINELGPAVDVYALGAILYEMLVGRPPFKGATSGETLNLVRTKDAVAPRLLQPSVPLDLETICLKCLRKDPEQRYDSAEELEEDLKRFRQGRPIRARPVGAAEQAWKFYRRNPAVVWTGAGVCALLVATAIFAMFAAVASASEASALKDKVQAERDKDTAVGEKTVVQGQKAVVEKQKAVVQGELDSTKYDLLIGAADKELSPNGDSALAERYLAKCDLDKRGWEWDYLTRRLDGEREPLNGHEGGLWSVAVHPNGTEAATASIDGTVRLWDLTTGANSSFEGHRSQTEAVVRVVERTGGAEALSGLLGIGRGVETTLSQVAGGTKFPPILKELPDVKSVPKNLTPVLRVAYSPDGKFIASGALDPNVDPKDLPKLAIKAIGGDNAESAKFIGRVLVWGRDKQVVANFDRHKTLITALAFSNDGTQVGSAGMDDDHSWKLWPLDGKGTVQKFVGHRGIIGQLRFSPDGKTAATGSTDGTAIWWALDTKKEKWKFTEHHATVHDLAFSVDGRFLATAGMDGTVIVWDLTKPDPTVNPVKLRGHIGSALGVAFSPDGKRVASGGFDRTVRVWDPVDGTEKITLRGHSEAVWSLAFDNDGRRLVSASFDGTARVWDATPSVEDGRVLAKNPERKQDDLEPDEDHRVNRLAYSRDGKLLATASWDRTATVLDAKTGEVKLTLAHDGPVWGVAFSPNGDRIVSGSWDTTVRLWDMSTGKERLFGPKNDKHFAKLDLPVQCVAYSYSGKLIAAGTWDGTVKVWDADTGKERQSFADHMLPIYSLEFSPDDRHLLAASGDRTASIRSLADGRVTKLSGHTATIFRATFDKDGRRVALASWDKTASVWDFEPARMKVGHKTSVAHDDYVNGVAFSPDGLRLATVGYDKTLRVWDAKSGQPAAPPRTLRGVVWDVTYSPKGDELAAAIWNPKGWVRAWPTRP